MNPSPLSINTLISGRENGDKMKIKCPYCDKFNGTAGIRGYPIREQLHTHILAHHRLDPRRNDLICYRQERN